MENGNQDEPDSTSGETRRTRQLPGDEFGRRSFLKLGAGAAAAGTLLAGETAAAPTTRHLAIVSTDERTETGGLTVKYEFTATGEIVPDTADGGNSAEGNDSVARNDDGTWTATGKTGNGFGDAYTVAGRIVDFSATGSFELYLDGEAVAVDDVVVDYDHTIEVLTTEDPSELDYTFTTTGEIEPNYDNGDDSAGGNDSVTENDDGTWTADGYTGNGYGDAYYFDGALTDFGPVEPFAELRVDGVAVDLTPFDSAPEPDSERHTIEVLTTEDPSELDYTFTTTGEIEPNYDAEENAASGNDSVAENDDGTWTADGYTGNGYGDTYAFEGTLTDFGPVEPFVEVRVDGTAIDLEQFRPERHTVEVLTTEDPSELDYAFTATGEIRKVTDVAENAASGNDSVTENDDGTWRADGYTGNGYGDTFTVRGEVLTFGPDVDHAEVRVDGDAVDLSGYEAPPEPAVVMGGGDGYSGTVPESAADVIVSTRGELASALNGADRGDVVYVDPSASIDVPDRELTIPSGVTLASDRGIDGADGGEIRADRVYGEGPLQTGDDVRVTGLRVSGPITEYVDYSRPVHSGVTVKGTGCEIDNVEISGFSYAGVKLQEAAYVHHSHIHTNAMDGLGYGIVCNQEGGDTLVEYNEFNLNRHSVANRGYAGYEVRYNHFGEDAIAYQVGTHRPGATTLSIHHNTFVPTLHLNSGEDPESHISIRGVPDDVADIHHNWFYNPRRPDPGRGRESVIQPHVEEFTNLDHRNNHYGADEPADDDIGCP
ncbi:right-handed parallel beta-helix repeat-containing protein [Halosimplex litoreum]|uniref:Right-handed parallel beta-helix repeat-containing protein n=1 Tax=Halosimplex litoreum TaxID=1198301 RepID=A0A7T3FZT3_9EURY|nr:right-handed parallel beta-helix repeat-containing protein [Halosimplex litoreum]QPV63756.1 right-handed parallel beta-helix repeat-containing protein [Halosimplex litoreum]